jgi:hypothetical protein
MSAVVDPAACAASSARFVAQVPPSCETATSRPSVGGRRATSSACIGQTVVPSSASVSRAAVTIAACSLVPQPVVTIERPG